MTDALVRLRDEIAACRVCAAHLPAGPRPVVQLGATARLLIIGQAPGSKVHATGIPWEDASGALVQESGRTPSGEGTLIYLDAGGELDDCLARVGRAGGTVVSGRTDIGGPGYVAVLRDTEGNLIALHSPRYA